MRKQQTNQSLYYFIILCCFWGVTSFGQTITKETILRTYAQGEEVAVAIQNKDIVTLNRLLRFTEDARNLVSLRKTEESSEVVYDTRKDIYYHPDIQSYIFTIHCAKWIKTDSDWGLNDYLYVLEMRLDFDSKTNTVKVVEYHLLQNKKDFRNWWRSFMESYNNPKFLRTQWSKDFNLVPPPPPPPGDTQWFKS